MIVNKSALLKAAPIENMVDRKMRSQGLSWGLTECGYDIRIAETVWLYLGKRFVLASSIEKFQLPVNLMGRVLNKSTWARRGIDASMTTNLEPGWGGYLTIELNYRRTKPICIHAGMGVCQIIFETTTEDAQYEGKYQNQPAGPVEAKFA